VRAASAFPPAAAHHRTGARGAASPGAAALGKVDYKRVCTVAPRGHAACLALIRTNVPQHRQPVAAPNSPPVGVGYGPPSLQNAYQLPSSTAGSGQTVAVVDAYDDPHAAADLAAYRAAWGLPPCGSGCFTRVNEHGQTSPLPSPDAGWALEESLDLDMVSAICPHCHIVLVEANSNSLSDLGTGVNAAVALGARFVSNSYGAGEFNSETAYDGYYNHPGVAVTVAAGDSGFGVAYPAASRYVTSVGGTTLFIPLRHITWSETAWGGTGSGCSAFEAKPWWQTDTGCPRRTDNDVAAVADPNTGVAVYDTYGRGGWAEVGGTSASSPIIASVYALAGTPTAGTYPALYPYEHTTSLFDVTTGSDGSCSPAYLCTAEPGYDGPTGGGTPRGTAAFTLRDALTPLSPLNGWTGGPFGTAQPAATVLSGIVHLHGAIATTGTNPVAFTLPAALRPATNVYVPVDLCNAAKGRLDIQPTGTVTVQAEKSFASAQCFTSLDGASYALTATTPLTPLNGWTGAPFGTSQPAATVISGVVHLKGAIAANGSTNPVVFTLPPALRPATNTYIPVDLCNAANGRLDIQPNGTVTVQAESSFAAAQCFTSLDGASYALTAKVPLTTVNGWTGAPFGTSQPAATLTQGVVQLKGAIATTGTNPVAFTLPPGFRPVTNVYVPADLCNAANGRLDIQSNGTVTVQAENSFSAAQCFTSLDGVSFVP
jgi:hypothetical protein